MLLVSKLYELSTYIMQLFSNMSKHVSISTIPYFLDYSGLQTFWVWYANHAFYFGHLRYINTADIERFLGVAYLERPISTFSQFFQLFFLVCKFYKLGL